jgi:hypothetical protein
MPTAVESIIIYGSVSRRRMPDMKSILGHYTKLEGIYII